MFPFRFPKGKIGNPSVERTVISIYGLPARIWSMRYVSWRFHGSRYGFSHGLLEISLEMAYDYPDVPEFLAPTDQSLQRLSFEQ